MPLPHPLCKGCPEAEVAQEFIPPDPIEPHTRLVVWGERGGVDEGRLKRSFVGRSGSLIRGCIQRAGMKPGWPPNARQGWSERKGEVAFTNVLLCRHPKNVFPSIEIARGCLKRHQPEWLSSDSSANFSTRNSRHLPALLCGGKTIETLTGAKLPITKTRGTSLRLPDGSWAIGTIHPAFLLHGDRDSSFKSQDHLYPCLVNDVARAFKAEPRIPTIHVVDSRSLQEAWEAGPRPSKFGIDVEGWGGDLSIVGLSWKVGEAWVALWDDAVAEVVARIMAESMPVAHNAPFDLDELNIAAGIPIPEAYIDTVNTSALYTPAEPTHGTMGLQFQVLTHIPGSVAWKGIIDHKQGYEYCEGSVAEYRQRWTELLQSIDRRVPATAMEWFLFYNGLDAAWGFELWIRQKEALGERYLYYQEIMGPLQTMLFKMGKRGLRLDEKRRALHWTACDRLVRMATNGLQEVGQQVLRKRFDEINNEVVRLEAEREAERRQFGKRVAFSKAKELIGWRTKRNKRREQLEEGFDPESNPQRCTLLYGHYELPEVRKKGNKGPTTDQPAIENLLSRLMRGTIKPKRCEAVLLECPEHTDATCIVCRGTGKLKRYPEAEDVLRRLKAASVWSTWRDTYLKPRPEGVVPTTYSQHRNVGGRIASGTDDSDVEKQTRQKKANLQNQPPKLRDMIIPREGFRFLGADWRAVHWRIVLQQAACLPGSKGFHANLLAKHRTGHFDPHTHLAKVAFQTDTPSKQQRQWAKAFVFGRLYLGAPATLGRKKNIPDAVSKLVCGAHEEAFRVKEWQKWTIAQVLERGPLRGKRAKRGAYIESPLGWRRYMWDFSPKETDILATSVLCIEADLLKTTLLELSRGENEDRRVVTSTHDSVLIEFRDGLETQAEEWVTSTMERPIPWLDGWSFPVKTKIGSNWKEASP